MGLCPRDATSEVPLQVLLMIIVFIVHGEGSDCVWRQDGWTSTTGTSRRCLGGGDGSGCPALSGHAVVGRLRASVAVVLFSSFFQHLLSQQEDTCLVLLLWAKAHAHAA